MAFIDVRNFFKEKAGELSADQALSTIGAMISQFGSELSSVLTAPASNFSLADLFYLFGVSENLPAVSECGIEPRCQ